MEMTQVIQPPGRAETCKLAVWSLVLAILSFMCCGPFSAVPAVICGHMALSRIRSSGGTLAGGGLATAGLIIGYIGMVLGLLAVLLGVAIAIPAFARTRSAAREIAAAVTESRMDAQVDAQTHACIDNLRKIDAAKETAAMTLNLANGAQVTAQQISDYIPGGFAGQKCGAGGTYMLNPIGTKPTCTVAGHSLNSSE